jgi:hypothetical protein
MTLILGLYYLNPMSFTFLEGACVARVLYRNRINRMLKVFRVTQQTATQARVPRRANVAVQV